MKKEKSWAEHMSVLKHVLKRIHSDDEFHTAQFTVTGFFFFYMLTTAP